MFLNLLTNAIKFTPENGGIEIQVSDNDENVQIEIKDSGQGIKPEFLPHVFERFRQADSSYTRQAGGLGLGLAIVRHLVELHGGSVSVKSEGENRGATFTVALPLADRQQQQAEQIFIEDAGAGTDKNSLEGLRLLLVEDNEDSREMLKIVFEHLGMEVRAVDSAAEALRALEQIKFDVLISDVGLPGEDGYALMRQIRQLSPARGGSLPAIALTGYASLQDRDQAIAAGYQKHTTKPVDIENLVEMVESLLTPARIANQTGR